MPIQIMFEYDFDGDYPTWYSSREFKNEERWKLYQKFIIKIKWFSVDLGGHEKEIDLSLNDFYEIDESNNIFGRSKGSWDNFIDIFDKIDDQIFGEFGLDDAVDIDIIFDNLESFDEDISVFYDAYMICCDYINYLDDNEYDDTYIGLLPEPIYDIVRDYEYYHQIYNSIYQMIDVLPENIRCYFTDEDNGFDFDNIDKQLGKIIESYIKHKSKIKQMIEYLYRHVNYNRKLECRFISSYILSHSCPQNAGKL